MLFWSVLKYLFIPVFLLVFGFVYKKFPSLKQDNVIEELIEDGIKKETGVDVDLSPDTPETNGVVKK